MSTDFSGITFPAQKCRPADDAILRRALLSDGILSGCTLSYAGRTLTMGAGQLIACGRQFRHPASQNWPITAKTSGFARLIITLDISRSSTDSNFDMVNASVEYATTQTGFAALVQEDINNTGTRYQIELCVVSLGSTGITGIVKQLGKAAGTGGGLSFKVVGGTTRPAAADGLVWVNTALIIPSVVFSSDQPSAPEAGAVWFKTGTSGVGPVNLTNDTTAVYAYLQDARQWTGTAWNAVSVAICIGGQWSPIQFNAVLFLDGNQFEAVTGGWQARGLKKEADTVANPPLVLSTSPVMRLQAPYYTNKHSSGLMETQKDIDVTPYTKVVVRTTEAAANGASFAICVLNRNAVSCVDANLAAVADISSTPGVTELDISGLSGAYAVAIRSVNNYSVTSDPISIAEIRLEA